MKRIKKYWTKTEKKTVKLTVILSYKSGKTLTECKTILRPLKMELKDYNKLIKILEKYGKTR